MSDSAPCKYCGTNNPVGRQNCYKCGAWFPFGSTKESEPVLQRPLQDIRTSEHPVSPWRVDSYPAVGEETVKGAHDTDRGLLLLAIGLIIGALPVIGLLGLIAALIGAIFVIIGRDAFGQIHSRNVLVAAIVYILCEVVVFAIAASIGPSLLSIFRSTTDPASLSTQLTSLIDGYIIALAVVGGILGLSTVVFTYAIQNQLGRALLWLAFGISILLLIPDFNLLSQLPPLISQAIATSDPSPLYSIVNQIQVLRILSIIPSIIYALAYLNARSLITNGYIP